MKVKTVAFAMFLSSCANYDINSYRLNIDEKAIKNMKFGETKEFVMLYQTNEKNAYNGMSSVAARQIKNEFDKSVQENFVTKLNANSAEVVNIKLNIKTRDVKEELVECREQANGYEEHMLGKFMDFLHGDNQCIEDHTYYDIVATGMSEDDMPIFESRVKYRGDLVENEKERMNRLKSIFNKMTKYFGEIKWGQV